MKYYTLIWRVIFSLAFLASLAMAPPLKTALGLVGGSTEGPLIAIGHALLATFGLVLWVNIGQKLTIYSRSAIFLHLLCVIGFICLVYQQVGFEPKGIEMHLELVPLRSRVLPLWLPYIIPTALFLGFAAIKSTIKRAKATRMLSIRAKAFEIRFAKRVLVLILKFPPLFLLFFGAVIILGTIATSEQNFAETLSVERQAMVIISGSICFLLLFGICDHFLNMIGGIVYIFCFMYAVIFSDFAVIASWAGGQIPWQAKATIVAYFLLIIWVMLDGLFVARMKKSINTLKV